MNWTQTSWLTSSSFLWTSEPLFHHPTASRRPRLPSCPAQVFLSKATTTCRGRCLDLEQARFHCGNFSFHEMWPPGCLLCAFSLETFIFFTSQDWKSAIAVKNHPNTSPHGDSCPAEIFITTIEPPALDLILQSKHKDKDYISQHANKLSLLLHFAKWNIFIIKINMKQTI